MPANPRNSYQNNELHEIAGAIWHAARKYWTTPPGRDLRRAYDGGWIVDGDAIFVESMKQDLLLRHFNELELEVRRLIPVEMSRMRLRRASRNRG